MMSRAPDGKFASIASHVILKNYATVVAMALANVPLVEVHIRRKLLNLSNRRRLRHYGGRDRDAGDGDTQTTRNPFARHGHPSGREHTVESRRPMATRVLIVDDEPDAVELLTDTLRAAGYDTAGAATFEEGKRLLGTRPPPDVLITDVRLGHFNGLQLVVIRPGTTAAVVVSGFWDRTLEEEARRHGAVYLLKPVAGEQLIAAVRQVLERRTPPAPAA
jgi:CheY-like chemotaxis protein